MGDRGWVSSFETIFTNWKCRLIYRLTKDYIHGILSID